MQILTRVPVTYTYCFCVLEKLLCKLHTFSVGMCGCEGEVTIEELLQPKIVWSLNLDVLKW